MALVSIAVSLASKKKEMARTRPLKTWDSLLPSHAFIITSSSMNCLVSNALDPGITTNEREEDMFWLLLPPSRNARRHTTPILLWLSIITTAAIWRCFSYSSSVANLSLYILLWYHRLLEHGEAQVFAK